MSYVGGLRVPGGLVPLPGQDGEELVAQGHHKLGEAAPDIAVGARTTAVDSLARQFQSGVGVEQVRPDQVLGPGRLDQGEAGCREADLQGVVEGSVGQAQPAPLVEDVVRIGGDRGIQVGRLVGRGYVQGAGVVGEDLIVQTGIGERQGTQQGDAAGMPSKGGRGGQGAEDRPDQGVGMDQVPTPHRGEKLAQAQGRTRRQVMIDVEPLDIELGIRGCQPVACPGDGVAQFQLGKEVPARAQVGMEEQAQVLDHGLGRLALQVAGAQGRIAPGGQAEPGQRVALTQFIGQARIGAGWGGG